MADEFSQAYPDFTPPKPPVAWVTWLLFSSTVAVFIVQLYEQHVHGDDVLGNTLAFSPEAWAEGRYWTVLTYAWAHAVEMLGDSDLFWLHIVANMVPLVCIGPALEDFLGKWRFLGLYLGGAIAAALTWFFFDANAGSQGIIGASGAIFALLAGAGTAAPRARVIVYFFFVIPLKMRLGILAITVCLAEVAQIVFGWLPGLAHSAHLGGAAFGFLYVLAFRLLGRRRSMLEAKASGKAPST
jgi:membrane associated rhomboid family serine protease